MNMLTESFEDFKKRMQMEDLRGMAEAYWNDDASGDLSALGEYVLNNPKLFTAFVDEWAKVPANAELIRQWFQQTQERLPEPEDMPGSSR